MSAGGVVLAHAVHLEHAVTGDLLAPIELRLEEPRWDGWTVAERDGVARLVADADALRDRPQETRLTIRLRDGGLRSVLRAESEGPVEDGPVCSAAEGACRHVGAAAPAPDAPIAELRFTHEDPLPSRHVVHVAPAPLTVELRLVDVLGEPVRGASVELAASTGEERVALVETDWKCTRSALDGPGLYRSCPPRVWDERFFPFHVLVDGRRAATRTVDYTRSVTRHSIVVPEAFQRGDLIT